MRSESIHGDIGGRLRYARKQRGLSLHDAAGRTKLSISVLQALERNDFESLPRGIYRKGYLRSLAGEVGLDPTALAAEYDVREAPATLVFTRGPRVAYRVAGYMDRQAVAQAAADAR